MTHRYFCLVCIVYVWLYQGGMFAWASVHFVCKHAQMRKARLSLSMLVPL